jgi:hypothetical protein
MGFAARVHADTLVLFHHDPYHTDDDLEALLANALQHANTSHGHVCLAHEGMTIELDKDGLRFVGD